MRGNEDRLVVLKGTGFEDGIIEVRGETARLYVHGNEQSNLLVNDLKLGPRSGPIGLWIGPGTLAHFTNLRITQK